MTVAAAAGAVPGTVHDPGATSTGTFHALVVVAGIGFGLTASYTALLALQLGSGADVAALVVSSMGLSLLVVDFFGTRFVPRLGARGALAVSMLVFGIGSALSAATTSWVVVGAARVLQGFGCALFMGGGVQLAVRLAPLARRGGAIGAFNAAWFAGVAVGPIGGGLIAAMAPGVTGLRLLFAICAGVNFGGAVAAWFLAPRFAPTARPRWGLPRGLGVSGVRAWTVLGLAGLGQAVRAAVALTLVPLLGEQLGLGWLELGLALFALAVTDVGAMRVLSRRADRRGRALPLLLCLVWGALVTTALAVLPGDRLLFTVGALLVGVTVGAGWVLPTAMAVDLMPDPESALAAYRIASDLGMLAGGLLAGLGLALGGIDGALLGAAAFLLLGALLTWLVGETRAPHRPVLLSVHSIPPPGGPSSPEVLMPLPTIGELAVFAANQDITLAPERLAQAYDTHARSRHDLERLRALPLPFTGEVSEPATATAWIANGGRS
jgi:MFS transporter, DHA1 family, multidrug resistance protein